MEYILTQKNPKKITKNTENQNTKVWFLTFFPHPRMVLQEHSDIKLLNTIDEKLIC
jgi:riboflavin kinase/FMN adenylyltransferase